MQKIRVPQNSFQFGEVSGSLRMRTDTAVYNSSASSLENMIVTSEGSAKKRYGLKFITALGSVGTNSALFEFSFSNDEEYLVSVTNAAIRVWYLDKVNNVVTDTGTITVDTDGNALPFDIQYTSEYTFAQYGDVMFICHPLFMPRMLIRTGLTSFEVTPFTFDQRLDGHVTYQPYYSFQPHGITLDPSATTGSITLTTSADYFTAAHVGTIIRYHASEILITGYTSATVVSGTVSDELKIRLSILNPLRTTSGSTTVEVTQFDHGYAGGEAVTIEDAAATGGINTGNLNGSRTVLGIIDKNTWSYTAGGTASSSEDGGGFVKVVSHAATIDWSEQSYSAVRGYPAAVVFHENRLCFGGTIAQPDTIWMSQIGSFFNFDLGEAQDSEAINLVAATGHVNEIRYMISNRDLQIFGASGELYVPTYLNQAITPTNAQIRLQTPFGCAFSQPVSIDGATIFVQKGGKAVREYLYTDTEDAYTATSVSTIASHLITDPKFMAVSHGAFDTGESYAFLSNGNGDLALFNSNRTERRAAWTHLTTTGDFHAVCSVDSRVFALIDNGSGSMVLCEFDADIGLDQYVTGTIAASYLNVSSNYSVGDVVNVISQDGKSHYGQHTVVSNGGTASVYLPSNTGIVHAGISFGVVIESNPIDANIQGGPLTGNIRAVSSVVMDLKDTSSAKVNERSISLPSTFSGKKEYRLLGHSRDPVITISQNDPLPLQVNGFVSEVIT
tara:strand:- start:4028 stop:6211 length:2184 start_codon:yes stop_codon:yes gene_type:complete